MSMTQWAEREIAAACKRENPNWDGKSFDYGCSCYQSALKAYKSLMDDGHSGYSFSITRNILKKLLDEIPLSPITDEDFFSDKYESLESEEGLKKRRLKSRIQCPRRSSLFRYKDLKGNVKYTDIDRYYCINAENPSDTFSGGIANFIDKLYPITMPYIPSYERFKVYVNIGLLTKVMVTLMCKKLLVIKTNKVNGMIIVNLYMMTVTVCMKLQMKIQNRSL